MSSSAKLINSLSNANFIIFCFCHAYFIYRQTDKSCTMSLCQSTHCIKLIFSIFKIYRVYDRSSTNLFKTHIDNFCNRRIHHQRQSYFLSIKCPNNLHIPRLIPTCKPNGNINTMSSTSHLLLSN